MEWLARIASALRIARGDAGLWLGEIWDDGEVVGVRFALERALTTHFNQQMLSAKRWRYREDGDAVLWWGFSDLTPQEATAVERWLAARGVYVRRHIGNAQRIEVGKRKFWAAEFSHGGGPRSRWRQRIRVVDENTGH